MAATRIAVAQPFAARAAAPDSAYANAVARCVEAAGKELGAICASGESAKLTLPEAERDRYNEFESKLKECGHS